jgi:serine/threonine protein kinase
MTQLVLGLAGIHAQHILVRDLRPDNLFVSADGLSIKLGSLAVAGVTSALSPRYVFMVHVGGTRCVTSSTDNIMKIHFRITLKVEFIRGYIFICLFYV